MGELRVKQEEFKNLIRGDIRGVDLAVGFKGSAAPQQADPLLILLPLGGDLWSVKNFRLVKVQQIGNRGGSFQVAAHLNKLPFLAVAHGGIGHALEKMDTVDNCGKKIRQPGI